MGHGMETAATCTKYSGRALNKTDEDNVAKQRKYGLHMLDLYRKGIDEENDCLKLSQINQSFLQFYAHAHTHTHTIVRQT